MPVVTDTGTDMKCISIRQPWAWLIVNGFKDVENRTRRTSHRGPVLIHASLTRESFPFAYFYNTYGVNKLMRTDELHLGGIIGIAEIVDVVTESNSKWFHGPVGYVLANARPLPFTPYRGQLGLFEVPDVVVKQLIPQTS